MGPMGSNPFGLSHAQFEMIERSLHKRTLCPTKHAATQCTGCMKAWRVTGVDSARDWKGQDIETGTRAVWRFDDKLNRIFRSE